MKVSVVLVQRRVVSNTTRVRFLHNPLPRTAQKSHHTPQHQDTRHVVIFIIPKACPVSHIITNISIVIKITVILLLEVESIIKLLGPPSLPPVIITLYPLTHQMTQALPPPTIAQFLLTIRYRLARAPIFVM